MNSRERLFCALRGEEPDRPPHFELEFQIVEEAFGLPYPEGELWRGDAKDRRLAFERAAEICRRIVETYRWDALPVIAGSHEYDFYPFLRNALRPDVPLAGMIWHATHSIETVEDYMQFSIDLYEHPDRLHEKSRALMDYALERAGRLVDAGCELIIVPDDIAYNQGPFMSPEKMDEFVFDYLRELVEFTKARGLPIILHSDGDLRKLLDRIADVGFDGLQSIDPIAGMDLAEIKALVRGRMALMGNVDCGALHAGPEEKVRESARYALTHGPPGGGYIFSSSNTIFQGVPLAHYEAMLEVFRDFHPLDGP